MVDAVLPVSDLLSIVSLERIDPERNAFGADLAPDHRPEGARARCGRISARPRVRRPGSSRSDEPRPISTSRQPVFPRRVKSTPSSKNSGQPDPSSEFRTHDEAGDLRAAQAAGETQEQDRSVARVS